MYLQYQLLILLHYWNTTGVNLDAEIIGEACSHENHENEEGPTQVRLVTPRTEQPTKNNTIATDSEYNEDPTQINPATEQHINTAATMNTVTDTDNTEDQTQLQFNPETEQPTNTIVTTETATETDNGNGLVNSQPKKKLQERNPNITEPVTKRTKNTAQSRGTENVDIELLIAQNKEVCQVCLKEGRVGQLWVECEQCRKWYHKVCQKLSRKIYLGIQQGLKWTCFECQGK